MTPALAALAAGLLGIAAGFAAHAALARRALRNARRDPLTGLPARAAWTAQARKALRHGPHTVAVIDLDHFKDVNDTYGHAAGDHLLAVAASRMLAWLARTGGGGGACGRLGGDEFAVVTARPADGAQLAALAAALAAPVTLPGGTVIPASAAVGATLASGGGLLPAALAAADHAMYEAKHGAGERWRLADSPVAAPGTAPLRRARHHGPAAAAAGKSALPL